MNETLIGLISAAAGGVLMKIVDYLYARRKSATLVSADIRQELREDADDLKQQRDDYKRDLEVWKEKYFNILRERNELFIQLQARKRGTRGRRAGDDDT